MRGPPNEKRRPGEGAASVSNLDNNSTQENKAPAASPQEQAETPKIGDLIDEWLSRRLP